jgi:hypothetical protein
MGGAGGAGGAGGSVGGSGGMVSNTPPNASFTMNPNCTSSSTTPITFTSTSTDGDGDILTCSWVFASGTPGTSTNCTQTGVTFPNVSPYTVTLTVSDGMAIDVATMNIAPCP